MGVKELQIQNKVLHELENWINNSRKEIFKYET
jgi:hypothetical protein